MPLALLNISLLLYIAARTALWTEQVIKQHNVIQTVPERPSALKELSSSFFIPSTRDSYARSTFLKMTNLIANSLDLPNPNLLEKGSC